MIHLFEQTGHEVQKEMEEGIYLVEVHFEDTEESSEAEAPAPAP
jgi:hypothetical protein